jgi:hypothetical protein
MDRPNHHTIYATYRGHSPFHRIRLRPPDTRQLPLLPARITALFPATRIPDQPTHYTPELAIELINATSELPASKRALHIIIGEYRHALHALATQAATQRQPDTTR